MSVEHLSISGASASDISRLWDVCRRRGKLVEGARGQRRLWGNIFWVCHDCYDSHTNGCYTCDCHTSKFEIALLIYAGSCQSMCEVRGEHQLLSLAIGSWWFLQKRGHTLRVWPLAGQLYDSWQSHTQEHNLDCPVVNEPYSSRWSYLDRGVYGGKKHMILGGAEKFGVGLREFIG